MNENDIIYKFDFKYAIRYPKQPHVFKKIIYDGFKYIAFLERNGEIIISRPEHCYGYDDWTGEGLKEKI